MGAILTASKDGIRKEFELKRKSISGKIEFTSETLEELNLKIELLDIQAGKINIALSSLDGEENKLN